MTENAAENAAGHAASRAGKPAASQAAQRQSSSVLRAFLRHRMAVAGLAVFSILVLMAVFAPWVSPHDPYEVGKGFQPPSAEHWLGTDQTGRDILSRLIYGARTSLLVGVGAVSVYVIIGVCIGVIAGYFGRWIDSVLMRMTDVVMSFPYLLVILVMVSILGPSLQNIIIVLGILGWPPIARIVRGSVLSVKNREFIKAAHVLGFGKLRIMIRHILPNVLSPILVNATFGIATAIIIEASLSFLGMGVMPPMSSWGNMLNSAQNISTLSARPWVWLPPGIMIVLAVLSVNFIGDGLRDAIDPKRKTTR